MNERGNAGGWEELFSREAETFLVRRGEFLFRRGDVATRVYFVVAGAVRLERTTAQGERSVLFVARSGSTLAEAALFVPRYHCDAVAQVDSEARGLRVEKVRAQLADGEMAVRWVERLANELRRTRTLLEIRSIRSAKERVQAYFELLAAPGPTRTAAGGSYQLLADQLGLRPETLSRALRALAREGRIERDAAR